MILLFFSGLSSTESLSLALKEPILLIKESSILFIAAIRLSLLSVFLTGTLMFFLGIVFLELRLLVLRLLLFSLLDFTEGLVELVMSLLLYLYVSELIR